MENKKVEKEITFAQLWKVFKRSLILMIVAALIFGAAGAAYSIFIDKPRYKGTTTFWVNNTSSEFEYTSQAQTSAAVSLASSCIELASQDIIARRAVREYNLVTELGYEDEDACVKAVRGMIAAYKEEEDSLVFYVSVTSESRDTTFKVLSAVQSVMPGVLTELCGLKQNENNAPMLTAVGPINSADMTVTVKTSTFVIAFICAFVAAVAVYAVFFIRSLLDTLVHDENTVKEALSYPIVGSIPTWGSGDAFEKKKVATVSRGPVIAVRNYDDKILGKDTPFFVTEAFNTLRTNVIYSAAAAKNPVFAVTSETAGVGKTVLTANLGIALANLGKRVLLVECDMRCPSLNKVFGIKQERGFSELLAGIETSTEAVVQKYGDTSLDILFCGQIPPNPSELLSGYKMAELIEEWKNTYDYILLDTPPIGEVFDAGALVSCVNGYILAVRCNYSNINEVREAVSSIESLNGNIFGIIINDLNPKSGGKYKYGYYQKKA